MIEVKLQIDPNDLNQVAALSNLVYTLGGHYDFTNAEAFKGDVSKWNTEDGAPMKAEPSEPKEEAPKEKPKRKRRTKAEIAADKAKEEAAKASEEESEEGKEKTVEFADVRKLFAEKLQTGGEGVREKCIAKLKEFGASNLPGLPEDKYQDFVDFLNGLDG